MWELTPFCTLTHKTQQPVHRETDDTVNENDGLTMMLDNFCWIGK